MSDTKTVILCRIDNIGDVIFTLPLAAFLKQENPNWRIVLLARPYVKDIASASPYIDDFIAYDENCTAARLATEKADMLIHVFSNRKLCQIARQAGIPLRIASNRRWYHYLYCNRLVNLSRKRSKTHEAVLNFALLKPLGYSNAPSMAILQNGVRLQPSALSEKAAAFLDEKRFNLILHPLSNGNGREWPLERYETLINTLDKDRFNIIISGGPQEASKLAGLISRHPQVKNSVGLLKLEEFIGLIAGANGLLASSTGPLHIAASLGRHALGLYASQAKVSPLRWGPIGDKAQVCTYRNDCDACQKAQDCICIRAIEPSTVKAMINAWITP